MNDTRHARELFEQRLRHDLKVLADSLSGEPVTDAEPSRMRRRKRLVAVTVGLAVVAVPAVAAARALNDGREFVDAIAPNRIVVEGSVDGSRYLLIETDRTDECGNPVTGVELVEERKNLFGAEWNTTGYQYGETDDTECGHVNDTTRYLEDPALFTDSGAEVGDSFVWVYAVHPDVTAVRITSGDYSKDLPVHEVDGAGYAAFEVPEDLSEYKSELLIAGQVVPGSTEVQHVPQP
jgi:hypothetical protein